MRHGASAVVSPGGLDSEAVVALCLDPAPARLQAAELQPLSFSLETYKSNFSCLATCWFSVSSGNAS
jgi:hypothetical protein